MNARSYLTLLRPIKTVGAAGLYVTFVWLWGRHLFHLPVDSAAFLTTAVVAPVLLGSLLLGPVHEVMHRPFSAFLPGADLIFKRWHLTALAIVAAILVVVSKIGVPKLPLESAAGLVAAGLAFPLLNERSLPRKGIRPWFPMLILTGCLLAAFGVDRLQAYCEREPWLVFVAGLAIAAVSVRLGFDRRRVRERARREGLVFCFQTALFNSGVVRGEVMAQANRRFWSRKALVVEDWIPEPASGSTWGWVQRLQRIWHPTRRSMLVLGLVIGVGQPLLFVGLIVVVSMFISGAHWNGALRQVAQACVGLDDKSRGDPPFIMLSMMPAMPLVTVMMMTASRARRLWFPISRKRMSGAMASHALLQGLGLVLLGYLAMLVSLLAVRWDAGLPLTRHALDVPLASLLGLLPTLPLMLAVEVLMLGENRKWVVGVGLFAGPMVVSVLAALGCRHFVSPEGITLSLATTLACWALHRWALRRFYLTRDLDDCSVGTLGLLSDARQ